MKLPSRILLLILAGALQAQADCYSNPDDKILKGRQGDRAKTEIVEDCRERTKDLQAEIQELANIQRLIAEVEKEPFVSEYYAMLQNISDLKRRLGVLTSEITDFKGSFEQENKAFAEWGGRFVSISSEVARLETAYESKTVLKEDHPLKKLARLRKEARYSESRAIVQEYLGKYPEALIDSARPDWKPVQDLREAVGRAQSGMGLARVRLDQSGADFYNSLTQIKSEKATAGKIQAVYSKFRDESQLTELLRTFRILLAQGVYLTVKDDLATQTLRLKALTIRLGENVRFVQEDMNRDLALLEKASAVAAKSEAAGSYKSLQVALRAQLAGLKKAPPNGAGATIQKLESWLKEAEIQAGLPMQLKGEILYLEVLALQKAGRVRK